MWNFRSKQRRQIEVLSKDSNTLELRWPWTALANIINAAQSNSYTNTRQSYVNIRYISYPKSKMTMAVLIHFFKNGKETTWGTILHLRGRDRNRIIKTLQNRLTSKHLKLTIHHSMNKIPYHAVTSCININQILYVIVWKIDLKLLQIDSFVL